MQKHERLGIQKREKPIIFSSQMIQALMRGSKTQTRRIVKFELNEIHSHFGFAELPKENQKLLGDWALSGIISLKEGILKYEVQTDVDDSSIREIYCPYSVGDLLWVREAFVQWTNGAYFYKASEPGGLIHGLTGLPVKWKPSIHMPREASRITLEVTAVRCERLQDISEADAIAEGVERFPTAHGKFVYENYRKDPFDYCDKALSSFASLWQSIHGPESWSLNPWVWVYEFRRVKP